VGLGFEGGLGVVRLAILLDRITQSFGRGRGNSRGNRTLSRLTRIKNALAAGKSADDGE
jgi:glycine betaine/proline transport system permease protein